MIVVTGGAGFIGSNIAQELNRKGRTDIILVDDLTNGEKFTNLTHIEYFDYYDKTTFLHDLITHSFPYPIECIFHQGARSNTRNNDGKFLVENNYEYSKKLFHYAIEKEIPFIYASSSSVYGNRPNGFVETRLNETPLNVHAYTKLMFDKYVTQYLSSHTVLSPVCGLRYFSVYGTGEDSKIDQASIAFQLHKQLENSNLLKLYKGSDDFLRDFTSIVDVVKINLWAYENKITGIYNVGTGVATSFTKLAQLIIDYYDRGEIRYIDFPPELVGKYQEHTQADLHNLRDAGYKDAFVTIEEGIKKYMVDLDRL